MTKSDVIDQLRKELELKVETLKAALSETNESASGDETKSEGKYDTRAIEAGYLAQAQAEQLALAEESLLRFQRFEAPTFQITDEIGAGALVEVEQDGIISFYFLAPTGGGLTTEFLGCDVTVITPESSLYQLLSEEKLGFQIEKMKLVVTGIE